MRQRVYTESDIRQLKIIRSLRCANYSLAAILRMMNDLSNNPGTDIKQSLDTPNSNDTVITACDKLLTSLDTAEKNAEKLYHMLREMKCRF